MDLTIPYDGYYNFKGTVDNEATVTIGDHVIKKLKMVLVLQRKI